MPAPTTPRRPSNRQTPHSTPAKYVATTNISAAKSNASPSVKDRIKQWQEQGGGVVAPPSPTLVPKKSISSLSAVSIAEKKDKDKIKSGSKPQAGNIKASTTPKLETTTKAQDVKGETKTKAQATAKTARTPKGEVTKPQATAKTPTTPKAETTKPQATPKVEITKPQATPKSQPISKTQTTPKTPQSKAKPKLASEDTTPKKPTPRKYVDPDTREWVREKPRSSSTPRKRIVSDENWKKRRLAQREGQSVPGTQLNTPKEQESRRSRRESTRKSTVGVSERVKQAEEDSIRVYFESSREPSPIRTEEIIVELESTLPDKENDGYLTPSSASRRPSRRFKTETESILTDEDDGRGRRKTSYAEALDKEAGPSKSFGSQKSKKSGILGQMFSKPEPAPAPVPRVPTIEAWLNEQPDPFVDDGGPPVAVPAPLKTRSRRRKVSTEPTITEDANGIWNRIEPLDNLAKAESKSKRRRNRPSLETDDASKVSPAPEEFERDETPSEVAFGKEQEFVKEMSPSTLRRRGAARRNQSKPREKTPEVKSETHSPNPLSPPEIEELRDSFVPIPAPLRKQHPPTMGHKLSTIASVETFSTNNDQPQPDMLATGPTELKRRLTTHDDLMSVLSLPRQGSKKIRSARSVRGSKPEPPKRDINEVLGNLAQDETKYTRELNTLVGGVIPVLLRCMLSKQDMSTAAELFGGLAKSKDSGAITKPVMEMSVALERLKSLHKRIPLRDPESLLSWAQGAHKVYLDYLRSWRMGFQDVIINLAPADNEKPADAQSEGGMARDSEGDVVDSDGKKADVAYLLKRPLVRLKNLAKTFLQLNEAIPSERADGILRDYQELVNLARRRSEEERGRLEDEAAASIDASKARETRTLAVLTGVTIKRTRKVIARDYFELTLHHSSGQRIDCQAELLLRDNPSSAGPGGDLLLCEIDDQSRWLLFPPLETQFLSARIGDDPFEIVLMIRGSSAFGSWHELVSLRLEDDQTCLEWVQMLGSDPMPPKLVRSQSFINRQKETSDESMALVPIMNDPIPRVPSPMEIDIPIGEPSVLGFNEPHPPSPIQQWRDVHKPPQRPPSTKSQLSLRKDDVTPLFPRDEPELLPQDVPSPQTPQTPRSTRDDSIPLSPSDETTPKAMASSESSGFFRKFLPSRPKILSKSAPSSPEHTPRSAERTDPDSGSESPNLLRRKNVPRRRSRDGDNSPLFDRPKSEYISDLQEPPPAKSPQPLSEPGPKAEQRIASPEPRPGYGRATSSTPSRELPTIPRLRPNGFSNSTPLTDTMRDDWQALGNVRPTSPKEKPSKLQRNPKLQQNPFVQEIQNMPRPQEQDDQPPPPPPHRSPPSSQLSISNPPVLKPAQSPRGDNTLRRRSSSPLKHEYAPSVTSESDSESDSMSESTSDTSDEEMEADDIPTPLVNFGTVKRKIPNAPSSRPTVASTSLAPSESASQAPYRKVPMPDNSKAAKTIATAYYWSERGSWNPIHADECSIVVTPGLIEVFELTAAHSGGDDPKLNSGTASDASSYLHESSVRPLIGLELTPLVPLRRGTALDISIRSPPTERSKFHNSNNIMLRSRNAEECDALYGMINQARINNPTYIALQNARPSYQPPVTFNTGGSQGARHSMSSKRSSSWFFGGVKNASKPSYRASSAPPTPSIAAGSENSVGSITSAFRRLSGSGMFNIARSSVLKKAGEPGPATASLYSSESAGSKSGSSTPLPGHGQASMGGVNNLKIRLYIREDQNKWRDMGAARLTVLPGNAPTPGSTTPGVTPPGTSAGIPPSVADSSTPSQALRTGPRLPSSTHSPHRVHGNGREKRVLITSSKKTPQPITLLDATLGESCFERVARTGIAVSIWEEKEGGVVKEGGVAVGKAKVYMVQCAGEAEAAWVFGVVGRPRY